MGLIASCPLPSLGRARGSQLPVSWLNECWHTGFSLPEWEQGWKGEGKEEVVKVKG